MSHTFKLKARSRTRRHYCQLLDLVLGGVGVGVGGVGVGGVGGGDQEVAGVAAPGASETAEGRGVVLEKGDGRPLTAPALGRLLEE